MEKEAKMTAQQIYDVLEWMSEENLISQAWYDELMLYFFESQYHGNENMDIFTDLEIIERYIKNKK